MLKCFVKRVSFQTKKLHVREVMMALIVFETKTNPDDVKIRGRGGGEGGGHPDPEISRGEVVSKKFFGPQFGLKM